MFLKLLGVLVVPGFALPEDDHALARDDECSSDKTCSVQALQMRHSKNMDEDACSGAGELPSSDDLCYTGSFLVEKFFVKLSKQTATSGSVDLQAVGPKTTTCNGAQFQQSGSDITVEDTTDCGLVPGTDYTVKYCSNQDEIVVHMLKPMDVSVVLSRTPCAEAKPQLQALMQEHAVSESERGCSGYGTFPRGGVCYSGAFLVESLYARVVTQGAHHGYVNMKAVGAKHGQCFGAGYSQHGQYISVNAAKCGLSGMTYTIRYCPDQDVINLQITAPLAGNVVMRRSGCSGVLLEESQVIAEPVLPSPVAVQPPSWMQNGVSTAVACSGERALPSDSELCYQGTLLVETLSVRVLEHTENGGTVNIKAVGPQHGECKGAVFHQSGSNLTINDAKGCGLDGAEYKVQYCSDQDQVVVRFVKPMQVDVALARAKCEASLA